MSKRYHVVGMGNAVSDVIAQASDTFLDHMGIEKGIMQLIERERAEVLYAAMESRTETPGGSVANTIAGLGMLGLDCAFVGRVADDALGRTYAAAMADQGTDFPNPPVAGAELPTSRSMIFVSPDGERSMNTYLGVSADVGPEHIPAGVMEDTEYLFFEGYLFDKDPGKAAFYKAAEMCKGAGGRPGISLSDPFCVDRHRDDFRKLVAGALDYVISNEAELLSLYQTDNLEAALEQAAGECELVVCTRSGDGVAIRQGATRVDVPVEAVVPVDATGAGDQFAAGFLFGLVSGRDLEVCGRMGCAAAGEVISHMGPRPEKDLKALFAE
ncbi:MAG: adenosine kinase, partial [Pseudomonadota bacterium]